MIRLKDYKIIRSKRKTRITSYNVCYTKLLRSLDVIAKVYEMVVDAGVYRAESIKVAEAAKVIENSQRDVNIAFMNERNNFV